MSDINPPSNEPSVFEALNSQDTGGPLGDYKSFHPSGDGMQSFRDYFGEEGFKKFQENLCQYISNQIKEDEKKMKKASEKLKATQEGRDPDEVE